MEHLLQVMRQLRSDTGCPWDREQTHLSLRQYLLEEAAEAVDAISSQNTAAMVDELGDVLLQVAFHSVIAEQEHTFNYSDIEQAIVDKLIRRHPHVFGNAAPVDTADQVVGLWQNIKSQEKAPSSQPPSSLGALFKAYKMAKNAPASNPENWQQAMQDKNYGQLLWQIAVACRADGVNPEVALLEYLQRLSEY